MNRFISTLFVACTAVAGLALSLPVGPASVMPDPGICDFFPYWPGCP